MKRIFLACIFIALATLLHAQKEEVKKDTLEDGKWYLKGVTGLNMSQTALSNWSGGGENSLAAGAYLNGSLTRKSGFWLWDNSLVLEYGLTNTKSKGTQKAADKIDFTTQLGYSTNHIWYYTFMADFKSQFYKGYNSPDDQNYISKFMAPAYSNISLGIEYRPNTFYSVYFSPVAAKLTFVEDDYLSSLGSFGLDKGDKFRAELGVYVRAKAKKTIMENVDAVSTLEMFTGYDSSFGNVDIDWDLLLSMKINKFLSASVNTTLRYDDDVKVIKDGVKKGPKVQFKEIIGVGLAYKF